MSFLLNENNLSSTELQSIKAVKMGRIPRHIALIMDGNRRFAKKMGMHSGYGHYKGYEKFKQLTKWCLELGIPEITVFVFSIDNFNRTKNEIDVIKGLAQEMFTQVVKEIDVLKDQGIRMHIVGRFSLIPENVRTLICRTMLATRHNNKLRVNLACAYTGRDEISRAGSELIKAVRNNMIKAEDIDEALMSRVMDLSEPDLLIRTSGEVRLSDFMLWQVSNTMLYFTEVLWPEFSLDDLLAAIIHFQRFAPQAKPTEELSERKLNFIKHLETERWTEIEKYCDVRNNSVICSKL